MKNRRRTSPPTLCIQADNCSRENKNKYMFAFCACLVALGHFREVQLSFLIVGHTHDDIGQQFSVILNILKRQDILSLKQMLAQVETGPRGQGRGVHISRTFRKYKGLEWFHYRPPTHREIAWTRTRIPDHFRFYVQNNEPRVQFKIYCTNVWAPEGGYSALKSVLAT